ncbi:MAG TPA: class I SAM-dependent methyltransferase [Mucilaginibacter sp.]
MNNHLDKLAHYTKALLFEDDYRLITQAIDGLHDVFSDLSGVTAGDITDKDIFLTSGKAISTIKAAHCLREFERTRRFLRGINKAIHHLLGQKTSGKINILYAGCGPYATLLTPLTSRFTAEQLSFTLLDINPDSLDAVRALYESLGLLPYVKQFLLEDAITYRVTAADDFDIMLSETMLNALRKEPQVSIMANLIPQLKPGGLFIPQEITVNAALLNSGQEMASFFEAGKRPERMLVGTVYKSGIPMKYPEPVTLTMPPVTTHRRLALLTEINVYDNEKLGDYSCSLTLPYRLADLDTEKNYATVEFEYVIEENPHFSYNMVCY